MHNPGQNLAESAPKAPRGPHASTLGNVVVSRRLKSAETPKLSRL